MRCYLVRHGQDDHSVRGGWSASPLTDIGILQVSQLAEKITSDRDAHFGMIYTSDLVRAKQTADILSEAMQIPVKELSVFREVNNGVLAGMKNKLAAERYPDLYWNLLDWDQAYPEGESPHEFSDRISKAWQTFKREHIYCDYDIILVTHGGVIQIIRCLESGIPYTNKENPFPLAPAEAFCIIL